MINNDVLLTHIKDIRADIKQLEVKLFGNGQAGLLDRVNTLETMHVEWEKYEKRWKYLFTASLMIIGMIITLLQVIH